MQHDIIFSSDYISIAKQRDGFYLQTYRKGMSEEQFNRLISDYPEVRVTSYIAVRNALISAPHPPVKFGEAAERIFVEISDDELKAYVTLCVLEHELGMEKRSQLFKEVMRKLSDRGVIYGVKHDVILKELCNNKKLLVAEGIMPENGRDSAVKMYELKEPKPEAKEDGNVDHYELSLINLVKAGDWLGERLDPTKGFSGKSVKGNTVLPVPGKLLPLSYDRKTVKEVPLEDITRLYALQDGAVYYDGDKIGVSNHLEIMSNVDFKTGNIDFDGYLTVKGTIEDNFTVSASKDIEIQGGMGIGCVKEIESKNGSVYIKGGVAGKNRTVIKSKKDVYTKFISDSTIISEGSVHVGFYCLNSNITAKEVILDSSKGQIIGGRINAEIKVVSSLIGSEGEKRTYISVKGFDRKQLKDQLEELVNKLENMKKELYETKLSISEFTGHASQLTREQKLEYENLKEAYFNLLNKIKEFEDERKSLTGYLRTHGEGEISILKKAFPNTVLEIKNKTRDINKVTLSTSFYFQDGMINEI